MPLPKSAFHVELESQPDVVHTVEIRPTDQIVGEQTGVRFGMGAMKDAPMAYTHLWIWAAMVRTGLYAGDWPAFRADLVAIEKVRTPEDDDPDEDGPVVDPTVAGPSTDSP